MFDEVDKRLESWATEILPNTEISFEAPSPRADKLRVCLYLLDLLPTAAGRGVRLPPLQITLRYLVIVQGAEPDKVHNALGTLLVSAMDQIEFEIQKEPLSTDIWPAFGLPPQPSFFLLVPFKYDRKEEIAPPVRHRLTIKQAVLESLMGEVFVNQIPMTNASVEVPLFRLSTKTDTDGRFTFASIPLEPAEKDLLIRVKGKQFSVSTSEAERRGETLLFNLKLEE